MNPSKMIDKMRQKNGILPSVVKVPDKPDESLHPPAHTDREKRAEQPIAKKPKKEKIPHKPKALDKFIEKKGRLPDGSIFVATWDAKRMIWDVTLTVMDPVKPTHHGSASGLFRSLVNTDNAYRDHLKGIAAAPETQP